MMSNRISTLAASALSLGVFSMPAHAQQQDGAMLEEIVVTAQRRETNLQETPIAISVVTGAQLEDSEVRHISDILDVAPGVSFTGIAPNQTSFGLRGLITTDDSAGTDQSTGVFIDGLYIGRTMMLNQNLIDVERVEILRGPQGTLWGHNTVGGSINIITGDPTDEFSGDVRATAGSFGRKDISGRIAGPLSDSLRGQIVVASETTDGYITNLDTGNTLDRKDIFSTRAKLLWDPADNLRVKFITSWERNNTNGYGHVWYSVRESASGMTPLIDLPTLQEEGTETRIFSDGSFDNDAFASSLQIDLNLENGMVLTSQTGYIDYSGRMVDYSFFPVPRALGSIKRDGFDDFSSVSQELRLAGDPSGRLIWQVGAYVYVDDTSKVEDWRQTSAVPFSFAGAALGYFPPRNNGQLLTQVVETNSSAVFGQGTWAVNDNLNVTLGGRFTSVEKASVIDNEGQFSGALLIDAPGFRSEASTSWSDFTPKLIIDFPMEDVGGFNSVMPYISVANGWKSGSFGQSPTLAEASEPFRPEEAWNFEVGIKSVFWDNRARFNATLFQTDYTDLQVISVRIEGAGTITENADSKIDGLELDTYVSLSDWLDIFATFTSYDSKYADDATFEGNPIGGNHTVYTPETTWSLGAAMTWDMANGMSLSANINHSFKDVIFDNPNNNRFNAHPGAQKYTERSILNANVAVAWDNLEISVWGRNLTDHVYVIDAAPFGSFWTTHIADVRSLGGPVGGTLTGPRGAPRSYGVTLNWAFGS